MKVSSYYESTGRGRIDSGGVSVAQRSYTYNYFNLLPKSRDARIVDLGCSDGISLEWLLMNGYQNVVGVDSDEAAIGQAREKFKSELNNDQIVCMEAFSYLKECEDNNVDMILMFNVIEHIPKDVILIMVREIRRVLKVGGCFLLQTGNCENPFNIGLFARDFTHRVMYTKNSLRQLMLISGFRGKDVATGALRYQTTLKNVLLQLLAPFMGLVIRMAALSMRMKVKETAPIIYCISYKNE